MARRSLLSLLLLTLLSSPWACAGAGPAGSRDPEASLRARYALDPRDGALALDLALRSTLRGEAQPDAERWAAAASRAPGPRVDALLLLAYQALQRREYPVLVDRCLAVLDEAPSSPAAEVAVLLLGYAEGNDPAYFDRALPRLERAARDPRSGAELRGQAQRLLLRDCARRKDEACVDAWASAAGSVLLARAAGPYGVAPGLDFVEGIPEERAFPTACHAPAGPGPMAEVCPRVVRVRAGALECPPATGGGGTCLLRTGLRVERAGPVLLRVGSRSSFELELDGQATLRRDGFVRQAPAWQRRVVWLSRGWHGVALRVSGESGIPSVELALTDLRGEPVVVEQDPWAEAGAASRAVLDPGAPLPLSAADWLVREARQRPLPLLLAAALLGDPPVGDPAARLRAAERLVAVAPQAAEAHYLLGEALRSAPDLPGPVRSSRARQSLARALELQPEHLLAHLRLGMMDGDLEAWDQAQEHFDACVRIAPGYPWAHLRRFQVQRDRGWDAEARADLLRALELAPHQPLFAREALEFWTDQQSFARRDQAEQALLAGLSELAPEEQAQWAERRGDLPRALALWEAVGRARPSDPRPVAAALRLARAAGDREARDRALAEWEQRDPGGRGLSLAQARAALEDGPPERGLAALRAAVFEEPTRLSAHRLLAELQGRAFGASPDDLRALAAAYDSALASKPALAGWAAKDLVVLLESRRDVLLGRGEGYRVVHWVARLQTKQAADEVGEKRLPAGALLLEFRSLDPAGNILQPEMGQGKEDLSFSGLGIGATVEYRYAFPLRADLPGGGGGSRFFFAYARRPILALRLELCAPDEHALDLWGPALVGAPEPEVFREDSLGLACRRFVANEVPGVEPEPFVPPGGEWLPWLAYAQDMPAGPTFARVARSLAARLRAGRRTGPELEALAASLAAAAPAGAGPEELARRAFAWVRDEVRSSGGEAGFGRSALETLSQRRGNRTALLSALLQQLAVPHRVVLARPRDAEALERPLPDPSWYHWPLLEVELPEGRRVWLDVASDDLSWDELEPELLGAEALVLGSADPAQLLRLPQETGGPPAGLRFDLALELAPPPSGALRGTVTMRAQGSLAGGLRRAWPRLAAPERTALVERLLAPSLPGLHVDSLELAGAASPDDALELRVQVSGEGLFEPQAGGELWARRLAPKEFSLGWARGIVPLEDYVERPERQLPLLLRPLREDLRIELRCPGRSLRGEGPARQETRLEGLEFVQEQRSEGGAWIVERHQRVELLRLPAARYPALREAILSIDRLRSEGLRVRATPAQ